MISLQNIKNAIAKANDLIAKKNLSPEKLAAMSKQLDMAMDEYVRLQELKSIASVDGTMALDAAQYVYSRIGNTVEQFNRLPLAEKWVFTELLQKLLAKRIS